jgi:hypothetical protein
MLRCHQGSALSYAIALAPMPNLQCSKLHNSSPQAHVRLIRKRSSCITVRDNPISWRALLSEIFVFARIASTASQRHSFLDSLRPDPAAPT